MIKESENLLGKKFGSLTVIEFSGIKKFSHKAWKCKCDCGNIIESIYATNLKRGLSTRCFNCKTKTIGNKVRKHGESGNKVYQTWSKIKMRCHNPSHPDYYLYGLRGISVCDKWRNSFEEFYKDVGHPPTVKHSIDRINNNGNYEPGNVRWATIEEQANNKRVSLRINFNGNPITIKQASSITGFCSGSVRNWMLKGKDVEFLLARKK